jgi:hypothetical protein
MEYDKIRNKAVKEMFGRAGKGSPPNTVEEFILSRVEGFILSGIEGNRVSSNTPIILT